MLQGHPAETTAVTPPRFLVHDDRSANLNVVLAEDTRNSTDKPVRATVVVASRYAARAATEVARHYAEAGIQQVELRITPLGGDNESLSKIRSAFAISEAFNAAGLSVTLGLSGNIGQAAVALGHAEHYSVGIGMLERVDHVATINRQKAPPAPPPAPGDDQQQGPRCGRGHLSAWSSCHRQPDRRCGAAGP